MSDETKDPVMEALRFLNVCGCKECANHFRTITAELTRLRDQLRLASIDAANEATENVELRADLAALVPLAFSMLTRIERGHSHMLTPKAVDAARAALARVEARNA